MQFSWLRRILPKRKYNGVLKSKWLSKRNELVCKLTLRSIKNSNYHYVIHTAWACMKRKVREEIFSSMYFKILFSIFFIDNGHLFGCIMLSLEEIVGEK